MIDIKNIPGCNGFGTNGKRLFFGAAATLHSISESGIFPLLGLAGGRIADHTIQVKITLGGNLAGTIHYHETLLPLLLADASIHIVSPAGSREAPVSEVLAQNRGLKPGELIVKVSLDSYFSDCPYAHIKRTKDEKIGYPLLSAAAIHLDNTVRMAVSGLCGYPFRFPDLRTDEGCETFELADRLTQSIPAPVLNDISGSAPYRIFIMKKTAEKIIGHFMIKKGENLC
ncbi:hypothetical protein SDC9_166116 [bioreactor metagenome]|uniref:FAD-binding PCMH-type domain-containing protein n=1 Tax=bioreactor metagenome TaxID=1076179 RepID=A0A645G403_9ZZZZ